MIVAVRSAQICTTGSPLNESDHRLLFCVAAHRSAGTHTNATAVAWVYLLEGLAGGVPMGGGMSGC